MSDQLVAETATYLTQNQHKKRTFMSSVGFEPAITAIERPQTYAFRWRCHRVWEVAFTLSKEIKCCI